MIDFQNADIHTYAKQRRKRKKRRWFDMVKLEERIGDR